jgi:hypothetical protein
MSTLSVLMVALNWQGFIDEMSSTLSRLRSGHEN